MSVENAEVIDIMVLSDDHTRISLVAFEQRPLRDDEEKLLQIRYKLGAYVDALDSGQVPEAEGRLVSFLLVVPNEPRTPAARGMLERIHQVCIDRGEGFTLRVQGFPDTYADLIGMTVEERQRHDPAIDAPTPYPVVREEMSDDYFEAYLKANADARMVHDYFRHKSKRAAGDSRLQRFKRMHSSIRTALAWHRPRKGRATREPGRRLPGSPSRQRTQVPRPL